MVAISSSRLLRVGFLTTACFAASSAERSEPNPDSVPQLVAAATGQMADGIAKMLAQADTSLGKGEQSDELTEYFAVPGASVPTSAATALARLERRLRDSSDKIAQWATASASGQATHAADVEKESHHVRSELESLRHAIDKVRASTGSRASAAETNIAKLKGERDRLASELKTRDLAVSSKTSPSHEAVHLEDYLGWGKQKHDSHQPLPQPVVHGAAAAVASTKNKPAAVAQKAANKSNATAPKVERVAKPQTTRREWPKELQPPAALRGGPPMSDNLKSWLSGEPLVTPAPQVHRTPKIEATNSHLLAAKDLLSNLGNAVDVLGGHKVPAPATRVGHGKATTKGGEAYEGDPRLLAAEELLGHTADGLPHHQRHEEHGSHHKHHHRHQQHRQHQGKKA